MDSIYKVCGWAVAGLLLLGTASCSNEEALAGSPAERKGEEVTLFAAIGADTRTTVGEGYKVEWSTGDTFCAFSPDRSSFGNFTLESIDEESGVGKFVGRLYGDKEQLAYAAYPAEQFDHATGYFTLPSYYAYDSSNSKAPMVGRINSETSSMTFSHLLTGMVRITLKGLEENAKGTLKLTADNLSWVGDIRIGASTSLDEASEIEASLVPLSEESGNTISVDFTAESTTQVLDIPVPAGTYDGGIAVSLLLEGEEEQKLATIKNEVNLQTMYVVPTFDLSEPSIIEVVTPGSLATMDLNDYASLAIAGELNDSDFGALRLWATSTDGTGDSKTLDMSDVTITGLPQDAFKGCNLLTSISLPVTLKNITADAFSGCTSLQEITSPATAIGGYFGEKIAEECTALTKITLTGSGVVKDAALMGNEYLAEIYFSDDITSIGKQACQLCSNLTTVHLPANLIEIPEYMFGDCTSLSHIDIPQTVTTIGNNAFSSCGSLTEISIPESVNSIGEGAFAQCPISTITIPSQVKCIKYNTFSQCESLKKIIIKGQINHIGEDAFHQCENLAYIGNDENVSDDELPQIDLTGVKSIGSTAFYLCKRINNIIFSDVLETIGLGSFYGCSGIKSIVIPSSVKTIQGDAFEGCSSLSTVTIKRGTPPELENAFGNCAESMTLIVPKDCISYYDYTDSPWKEYFDTIQEDENLIAPAEDSSGTEGSNE